MAPREPWQLPDELSYEAWIRYVFDHPVLEPEWWFQDPAAGLSPSWNEGRDPLRTVGYLTRLFREPGDVLNRYSVEQIDQGLYFLANPTCSSHLGALSSDSVPWDAKRDCFAAMVPLYEELMAPVYGSTLGHVDLGIGGQPLKWKYSCYMWWEVMPIVGNTGTPDRDRVNEIVLSVFEQVLQMRSEACLESVLRGIKWWHQWVPERTEPLVRTLRQRTDISPALRRYSELVLHGGPG